MRQRRPVRRHLRAAVGICLLGFLSTGVLAVELQGHRGARGLWPEHTAAGFNGALAVGVDVLELDLGLTRDGVPVVHHDPRLSTDLIRGPDGAWLDGPGPLLWHSRWADFTHLDAGRARPGSRTAKRFAQQQAVDGQRLLRLGEVFEIADGAGATTVRFNIELKLEPDAPQDFADPVTFARAVIQEIDAHGMRARVTIQSFDWRALRAVQRIAPDIPLVALTVEQRWLDNIRRGQQGPSPWTADLDVDDHDGSVPRLVKALGASVWSPYFREVSREDVDLAHDLGLTVSVWTVNEPADIEAMLDLGVDSIISDYPDRVRTVMARRELPLPIRYPVRE